MATARDSSVQNQAATIELDASSQIAPKAEEICQDLPVENISKGGWPWPHQDTRPQGTRRFAALVWTISR